MEYIRSPYALQEVGQHLQGILMPFNVRNKRGHFASERTEFGLDVFRHKPLLSLHMLDGQIVSHGEFVQSMFEPRENGLFGGSTFDQFTSDFVAKFDTGFSLGTMSHLVEVSDDGHIDKFVVVEGSFGRVGQLANQPGTTSAHIQSFFPGVDLPDTSIVRGLTVMPVLEPVEPVEPVVPPVEVVAPVEPVAPVPLLPASVMAAILAMPESVAAIRTEIQSMDVRLTGMEEAPTRVLPDGSAIPPEPEPLIVKGELRNSRYANRPLMGMLFEDYCRTSLAHADVHRPYQRNDEFFRELVDKMADARKLDMVEDNQSEILAHTKNEDGTDNEPVRTIPHRIINEATYDQWHERVPNLQADEAMRTGFTSFGAELIPTAFSSVMYHAFRSASRVWSTLETFNALSYPTFKWPKLTGSVDVRRVLEFQDDNQSNFANSPIPPSKIGTGNVTFTAGGIGARVPVSMQLLKASAAPLLDAIAMEFSLEMAAQIDWVLMNGDESATPNISHGAAPANTTFDLVLVMDGLRHMARAAGDDVGHATIAITSLAVLQALMSFRGIIGDDWPNLVCFVSPEVGRKFNTLTEYQNVNEVTRGLSTLLNGELLRVNGIPIVSTTALELGDASGDYAGTETTKPHTTGTKGIFGIVHRKITKVAQFQDIKFISEVVGHARALQISSTWEGDIQAMEAGNAAFGFNTTV